MFPPQHICYYTSAAFFRVVSKNLLPAAARLKALGMRRHGARSRLGGGLADRAALARLQTLGMRGHGARSGLGRPANGTTLARLERGTRSGSARARSRLRSCLRTGLRARATHGRRTLRPLRSIAVARRTITDHYIIISHILFSLTVSKNKI